MCASPAHTGCGASRPVSFSWRRRSPTTAPIRAPCRAISWWVMRRDSRRRSCSRVKASSDFVLEIHYTTNGTASTDRSKFGLVFAKERPQTRVLTLSATNGKFKIPPRDPNYRVDAEFEVGATVKLASLHPHMHGRGKDFEYRIVYPAGETQTILRVPRYDWHWQLWYNLAAPMVLPEGTRIECTAHFDNSPNNPDNADPSKEVTWGDQR